MFSSRKKKHSPSNSTSASGLASSRVTHQEDQQSQPVYPWSTHAPPSRSLLSPLRRNSHALSPSATAAGELFLFGGYVQSSKSPKNDLYVISTRDYSITPLKASGDVPSPRYGHRAVLTGTNLLVWGGKTVFSEKNSQNRRCDDDSLYSLNLVSREWTRIVVNGPGPSSRFYHTMTLVDSKLFVFGGSDETDLNDIWALDLDCLTSNPRWESCEPAPGNKKPLPRANHISVTTGDRIIIFGGASDHEFNDTWSFNVSTRTWTELQCTGSIPSPRFKHAAVLVDDVMYVFGGRTFDRTYPGDLTALNLSTQRWTAFQDIGPSPCGRVAHAMASDGRRIFVLGGKLLPSVQVDEAKPIYVLDTKLLIYPKPDSNTVKHNEKTTQLAQKSSARLPTQGQSHQPLSFPSDAHAARGASPFQRATPEEPDHPDSQQVTCERKASLNGPQPQPTGVPRWVPQEDDDSEGSTGHLAKAVAPDTSSEKGVGARLEHERIANLERQLLETLAERDQQIAQLTDQLVQKSTLLEQAAESKKRAGLEQRDLQARLEARESELTAVRLRLMDAEVGWAKSKAEADTLRAGTQAAAGLVNMDVDRVMGRLMERVRSVEVEMASLRGNEKSIEEMECRNEG